ncbi:MAG: chorismate synthase [Bifidobacteriaceae bacterium]|jgi:chorismate synthase|nr:chorismate synthase [Bifidobacteriaceae bacterium]
MLRWLTAGESHGPAVLGVLEGIPAGVAIDCGAIAAELARRRLGYGRGARMGFEADQVEALGGLWRGLTTGGPVAIAVANSEWPKWREVMDSETPTGESSANESARAAKLTRPRPGHADLAGMIKYQQDDARVILERSSARETAARVALGAVAAAFLRQAFGIEIVSHVVSLGGVTAAAPRPLPEDGPKVDSSPVRTLDGAAAQAMAARIEQAKSDGDTLGGVVEVIAYGVPVGLGSHVQADRRLDAALAGALMSIQAIKAVEVGLGLEVANRPGSEVHDQIFRRQGRISRSTNNAGGIEGGISNGEPIVLRAAMKPIPTVPHALATIDLATGEEAPAHHQRSDITAVPAAAVVAEAVTALVLARAALEKFGGDCLSEVRRNYEGYLAAIPEAAR